MATEPPFPPPVAAPRGRPILAWLVILGMVAFILVRWALAPAADNRDVRLVLVLMQGRYLVGLAELHLPGVVPADLHKQGQAFLGRGPFDQRLRYAIVAGELDGPREAVVQLHRLNNDWIAGQVAAPEGGLDLAALLIRLYRGYEKGPTHVVLDDAEQALLRRRLGWFGDLALAPAGGADTETRDRVLATARRTALAQLTSAAVALGGAAFGLGLLLFALLLAYHGRLGSGLTVTGHGGIYAETFAVYLVLFQGLGQATRLLPADISRFVLTGVVMVASLGALGWPVLRGVPWQQVRRDLGLWLGRRPALEPLAGLGCYVAALPLVLAGVLLMFLLMQVQRRLGLTVNPFGPAHPIIGVALRANVWTWVQLVILAAVLAPLIEEIMFRGVLYRHLRELTSRDRFRPVVSAVVSGLASSFVFAAIHPQGLLGIPVLMALALAFALAREWRDTLVPPMVAHAINNGAVAVVLMLSTT
jgi:membrane protease YdiL (CAAX protease family)